MANPTVNLSGTVTITALANLRQGGPSTTMPVLRKLAAGSVLAVVGVVSGEAVEGNAQWFRTADNAYIWSGACGPFVSGGVVPPAITVPAAPGPAPSFPSSLTVPNVVDLYHGDVVDSFAQAAAAGLWGVIHKATTGATGTDQAYAGRRSDATAAGLLWGAYHWGTNAPVQDQVTNFLNQAQPDANTLLALDYESDPTGQMTLDLARAFLQEVEARVGRKAVLYSGSLIKSTLGTTNDPFFAGHRLWLAQYGPQPTYQASWSQYWLWQYSAGPAGPGPKSVPGIPGNEAGELDCDFYAGTREQLTSEWAS
jgi:GH25 family lysozyme M1 (1,4-beta-N-acetylmuramidase)